MKNKIKKEKTKKIKEKFSATKDANGEKGKDYYLALLNILEDTEDERRKAEQERDKTLLIINSLVDGLIVFNKKGKISLANPQFKKFFKIKSTEIIGKSINDLGKDPKFASLAKILIQDIGVIFRKELKITENLVLEVSKIPIVSEKEELGILTIFHDITREKIVERIKTEFVSLAAHQLRTPLSAIKWTLKTLLDGDFGEITSEQREFIGKSYKSNERMIGLVNDLLDVARIEEGRYLYKSSLTNFESIISFIVNSHKDESERKKIEMEFKKLNPKIPEIAVDVEKIRLAVDNLIDNAIKYTPEGGRITISLDYLKEKKEIEFIIQDSGVGIPKDQQERVFSKFFRGANVVRLDTEGSGLGIFITKNIIEAHGGRIWFESEENKGTKFHFTLPVKEEFLQFLREF